ncbi:Translation initiation factor 3 subunit b [Podila epicladia]|nr:Translation initiation factor 3 subunit b [Podila epicladia]KAG0096809.1 Translation initiation factor 3 subunit b [Podila epicladia]
MACKNCSIIPSYILKDITDSSNVPQTVRDIATKSFTHSAMIHHDQSGTQGADFDPSTALSTTAGLVPRPVNRDIYDAGQQGLHHLPGILVFADDIPTVQDLSDESVRNVHGHFEKVYDFYQKIFNRNSYDDKGAKLVISVHFDADPNPGFDNSFWFPRPHPKLSQWVFGDGDSTLFNNFTKILDVSAHDFTHAVVDYTGILPYFFQSGALNESISDVFSSMIKQYFAPGGPQKVEDADWLFGEGLWSVPGGKALRDMENPGTAFDIPGIVKDRQPAAGVPYEELPLRDDNGGVHIYSSIPNRAFVLVAKALGGYSWEVAGQIWYASLTDPRLRKIFTWDDGRPVEDEWELIRRSKDTFKVFANLTIEHARAYSSKAVEAVQNAWTEVRVLE